jgi:cysteine desulfurase
MKRIYMDHAATTPVAGEVLDAMKLYFSERFGNSSSLHSHGRDAAKALEDSRAAIAAFCGCAFEEVFFTSGGTESDNMALKGAAFANRKKGRHIITTKIEHHAVLHVCDWLEKQGFQVTRLPVDRHGLVEPAELEKAIKKNTIIASVMWANNEIGTIEPVREIGKICRERGVLFHTDAVQAFGKVPMSLEKSGIDMLSASAHKLYGPKGVGLLYIRKGVSIESLLHGGGHEMGMRSGTENVAGIVGFARACELAGKNMETENTREIRMRDALRKGCLKIGESWINGHPEKRLANNVNAGFKYIEGESLILHMDAKGVSASTGSACSSKSLEPSHVLTAIGLKPEEAHGSLRLTLGRDNTPEDVKYVLEILPGIVENLRKTSPFNKSNWKEALSRKWDEHGH